jgi:hypothetical protein
MKAFNYLLVSKHETLNWHSSQIKQGAAQGRSKVIFGVRRLVAAFELAIAVLA